MLYSNYRSYDLFDDNDAYKVNLNVSRSFLIIYKPVRKRPHGRAVGFSRRNLSGWARISKSAVDNKWPNRIRRVYQEKKEKQEHDA